VIESLPSGQLRTGRDLFESAIAPVSVADSGFVSELYEPGTGKDLLGILATIASTAKRYGRSPIIHFETHGNSKGLQLRSGDFITWQQLAPLLTTINEISRMNLLVVAAMCHGWHLSSVLRPTDRAPAFGVVGTEKSVKAGALFEAMKAFYGKLLSGAHDLRDALAEANNNRPMPKWRFKMEGAEIMLCRVFSHYVEEIATEATQTERVSRIVADIARSKQLDVVQTMQLRAEVREAMDDHRQWFDHYRSHFLMLDLFPANAARFRLQYADCGGDAA
jgi:hypothetical protein